MAKKETNDAKREEMKALVVAALNKGWTQPTLAAFFGYSSFSAFANGKSMGTNELRAQLRQIESVETYRHLIEKRIAKLDEMCIAAETELLKQQAKTAPTEEEFLNGPLKPYIAQYPQTYTYANHLVQFASGKEWSINRAQNHLDTYEKWLSALQKAVGTKEVK